MTGPTHIAAGLIIGHFTGDYVTAVACSLLIDTDHLLPIIKKGVLFKPKLLWKGMTDASDKFIPNERNYLHSIFTFIILSAIVLLISLPVGIVFTIAYAVHLGFDMLDKSDYFPLFPSKLVNIKGWIRYCSRQEMFFAVCLFAIWFALVITGFKI